MRMTAAAVVESASYDALSMKVADRSAKVGVIGLGYVGCPLAVEFAKAGYCVTGIDLQQSKVDIINNGKSHIQDVPEADVGSLVANRKLRATTDFSAIRELDTISICVPTPLHKT